MLDVFITLERREHTRCVSLHSRAAATQCIRCSIPCRPARPVCRIDTRRRGRAPICSSSRVISNCLLLKSKHSRRR